MMPDLIRGRGVRCHGKPGRRCLRRAGVCRSPVRGCSEIAVGDGDGVAGCGDGAAFGVDETDVDDLDAIFGIGIVRDGADCLTGGLDLACHYPAAVPVASGFNRAGTVDGRP